MSVTKTIWSNYPTEKREALFKDVLKGGWPNLVDNENYLNTCAIRMSVALNRSGYPVTASLGKEDGSHKDGNGNHIIIRVPTVEKLFRSLFGESHWGMSKKPGAAFDTAELPSAGLLLYRANFANAFGHTDVWDGSDYPVTAQDPSQRQRFEDNIKAAYEIALWTPK